MRAASRRRRTGATVLAVLVALGAVAAGSPRDPVQRPGITCQVLDCRPDRDGTVEGTLDGLSYALRLPTRWNGVLLVWSHGYRRVGADPLPAKVAPDQATADALVAQGYALAGSAWAADGWAVPQAVEAAVRLRAWFARRWRHRCVPSPGGRASAGWCRCCWPSGTRTCSPGRHRSAPPSAGR